MVLCPLLGLPARPSWPAASLVQERGYGLQLTSANCLTRAVAASRLAGQATPSMRRGYYEEIVDGDAAGATPRP